MRFNVSQKAMVEIKKKIEEDMSWKLDRKDTPKARKQLANLPASACIICIKTGEVVWAEIYRYDAQGLSLSCWMKGDGSSVVVE